MERKFCIMLIRNAKKHIKKQPPELFCKKRVFLKISQNSQKNICARDFFFNKVAGGCEISKNTFSYRAPPVAASVISNAKKHIYNKLNSQSAACDKYYWEPLSLPLS